MSDSSESQEPEDLDESSDQEPEDLEDQEPEDLADQEPEDLDDPVESDETKEPSDVEVAPRPHRIRAYIVPLLTLAALSTLLISFRTILLPFIFACLVVYLMEPIVSRIGRTPESPNGLPRWAAVILVYLVFIGTVTVAGIIIVPRFVSEFARLGETIPNEVQKFRAESLPDIDEKLQDLVEEYLPVEGNQQNQAFEMASETVLSAREQSGRRALAFGHVNSRLKRARDIQVETRSMDSPDGGLVWVYDALPPKKPITKMSTDDALGTQTWRYGESRDAAMRLVPETGGGVQVYLSDVEVEVEQTGEGKWLVRRKDLERLPELKQGPSVSSVNLSRSVDEVVSGLVDTSTERIANIIDFARALVVGIIQGFVAIVLTLMVAAFMSIDLYRVKGFFRQLIPDDGKYGYDRFLAMADRGLAGVVRGQLLICLVNGFLTWVGLAFLGVRFSVLLGVVAGILSMIPVFGTVLSTVPIVLIGLTDGLMTGVLALGWILLIHFIEANFLNPKIIGSSAHIHPVIVIFALLAGENAYGLVGALLAVPTASLLLTLFNFVRLKAWRENSEAAVEAAPRT